MGVLYNHFTDLQFEQLKTQTALAAQGVTFEGAGYFKKLNTPNVRITWVDKNGTVLYDSKEEASQMENHSNREEIKQALKTGFGESSRYSATLATKSLYVAQLLNNGTIVRLSVTQHSIFLLLLSMAQPIGIIIILAILFSVWVAKYTAKKVMLPLNNLNLDEPLTNDVYDEMAPLLRRIDQHQRELAQKEELLLKRKKEFDTIISRIREGIILLDTDRRIISINSAAEDLFAVNETSIGKDILEVFRDSSLDHWLEEGLAGQKTAGTLFLGDKGYRTLVRPTSFDGKVTGLVLLLFDITDQLQAEALRREFTANVSHELKTPLHVISGYSEMLAHRMVSEQDVARFGEKIYKESQRLVQLVEDIINLSQLDEAAQLTVEDIDIYKLTENVIDSLETKAKQRQVSLHLLGSTAYIKGNAPLLHSLIYNLCDNAITYNQEKGEVVVTVTDKENELVLEVRDTGIGIAKEEQDRIFERFYRVDKSRSKKVGGTGLGLSIVKHALTLHHARIQVQSSLGQGTSMSVHFPKNEL